jgi:hypothetical protein
MNDTTVKEAEEALSKQPERWRLTLFEAASTGFTSWYNPGDQLTSDHQ